MYRFIRWLFPELDKAKNGSEHAAAVLDQATRAFREDDEAQQRFLLEALRKERKVDR